MGKADVLRFCGKLLLFVLVFAAGFAFIELYVPLKRFLSGTEQDWGAMLQEVNFKRYFIFMVVFSYLYGYSSYRKETGWHEERKRGSFKV